MIVHILNITTRYGQSNYAFTTEALAQAKLDAFIYENWEDVRGDEPIPEDYQDRVCDYFNDGDSDETYDFDWCVVDGDLAHTAPELSK